MGSIPELALRTISVRFRTRESKVLELPHLISALRPRYTNSQLNIIKHVYDKSKKSKNDQLMILLNRV